MCVDHVEKDSPRGPAVDVVATAYDIPLPDAAAQTVLLTEVLEHLERPADALADASACSSRAATSSPPPRSSGPSTTPATSTATRPQGLRYLFEGAGFEVVELRPLGGLWSTVAIEVSYGLQRYRRPWSAPAVDATCRSVQWLAQRWERVDNQPKFSWNHLIVGRRPA